MNVKITAKKNDNAIRRFIRPGNSLASRSTAVHSLLAPKKWFPDGDMDKIRFIENCRMPVTRERWFPSIREQTESIKITDNVFREILMKNWILNGRKIDENKDRMTWVARTSIINGAGTISRSLKLKLLKDDGIKLWFKSGKHPDLQGYPCNKKNIKHMKDRNIKGINLSQESRKIPLCLCNLDFLTFIDVRTSKIKKVEGLECFNDLESIAIARSGITGKALEQARIDYPGIRIHN
jgi:hypothetical protein